MPMASLINSPLRNADAYWVVHPLDDLLEEKRDPSGLGPMPMTLGVRLSLFALRAYLILMAVLVAYHFVDLAGLPTVFRG
jgi:hypothetical protein